MKHIIIAALLLLSFSAMAAPHHSRGRHRGYKHHHGRHVKHSHRRYIVASKHLPKKAAEPTNYESVSFAAQKGMLTWPAMKAYKPESKSGYWVNGATPPGIDIYCAEGARVNAVYDGEVSSVFSVDNDNDRVVILKHGNYFTVYNSLSSILVKTGDRVCANQPLGTVGRDDDGKHVLNFQIWKSEGKNKKQLEPGEWLSK